MSASAKSLAGGASELILAADEYRDHVTLQLQSDANVFLAFGEAAASDTGIGLVITGDSVRVTGAKARDAIYGYSNKAAMIGIETCEDIEYRPGPTPAL